jgi:hypothetical protein
MFMWYNFCLLLLLDSPIFAQFFKEFEKITLLILLYIYGYLHLISLIIRFLVGHPKVLNSLNVEKT